MPSFKRLGIILHLTKHHNQYNNSVLRNIIHKMAVLCKAATYYLHNDVALQIYKSLLLPYLEYADITFERSSSSDLDTLQGMQNRSLGTSDRFLSTNRVGKYAILLHAFNFMYTEKLESGQLMLLF